jgi:chromate transporter
MLYREHGDRASVTAMLHGVAAAAVGLILATTVQLGRKSLSGVGDLVFVVLAVLGVNWLDLSVPVVLLGVGALAIAWHRPRGGDREGAAG